MSSDLCGSSLLLSLPDEIFSVITSSVPPRDVCSLGLSCRGLNSVVSSDKAWLAQCDKLGLVPFSTLIEWRKGVSSYKALCRFLVNIQPLMGIWVHKNPEVGNVVYVMPGFLSVVGCRIVPQTIGPLGLEDGPLLWTSVFEIFCKYDGSTAFLLHGRERGEDYVYPGFLKSVDRNSNMLLLEVEPLHQLDGRNTSSEIPFSPLESDDGERLLDFTSQVRDIVPDAANMIFFPPIRNDEFFSQQDFAVLHKRRLLLLQMYERTLNPTKLGSSAAGGGDRKNQSTTLHGFLQPVGLCLRAETMESRHYKAWPSMYEGQSILYKMPLEPPKEYHEYAGLWGGTYGWTPRRLSKETFRERLFLIMISYEVSEEKECMIATKILEGSSYAERPNGSTMFTVDIDLPALELFPCDSEPNPIDSFGGEGIVDGNGFRYPGSKPGSLFVLPNGLLVFIYKEWRIMLTLQRLDLAHLLRRDERVYSLPPIFNFVYPTRMYMNPYPETSNS
ncbi:PREDICTED: F-box protein At5g39450-like [Erythranthe guttata]|uniref:F-box protein At5g39450-like n=1 Tax=Erythranthe guttata TaxID=4155 RepID=UPI00064DEA05|nr:PREDICTED: F-box protein At5g39450-like [Erythranthe guttata]|eukprot:XP_012844454.1 PREDICTED: F-box protein At5g39450-like [Erythranthe guttata]